jgi:hypothetical protein
MYKKLQNEMLLGYQFLSVGNMSAAPLKLVAIPQV